MKRTILTLIIFATALAVLAQATQPCVVKQYNQKQQKTPLAGVQVTVNNAGNTTSGADGRLTLTFRTLKPGDHVSLISAKKPGYEIFNKHAVDQWTITRGTTFELVLVRSDYFAQLKEKLTQSSTDSYKAKYEQALRELEKQKKAGKMKEAEYNQKLDELETNYQTQLTNLDNYIDQFARIDLSQVSAEEQRILDMVDEGKIDEAVKAYEALDISGKLRQARENKKALSEAKARIEEEEAQQEQAIKDLKEKQQREIATLKLAGGKENYDKVARILKENALADTTDIDAVEEYGLFAFIQCDFKEAERFYLISLNGSKDDFHRQTVFQNILGLIYNRLQNFSKSEEYYLKAMESCEHLYYQDTVVYIKQLAIIQSNLGALYSDLQENEKAEEYFLKALENLSSLSEQNPDAYREELAEGQHNLGTFYERTLNYTKAKEYYLKALNNETQLFNNNPDAFRPSLALTLNNLGNLHTALHDYAKAEEYKLKALEHYTQLFRQNPDAYRASLATTQNNLGALYMNLHNYAKAEEYFLQAMENKAQLFSQNPETYCEDLANIQNNLGNLHADLHDYAKAEEYYLKALENYTQLFSQNPEAYRADLATIQNDLGNLYKDIYNYSKAEEYHLQALENRTQLFNQNPDAYREGLAMSQINLGVLYHYFQNYSKAEEYYLKALENYTYLFNQDLDTYRTELAKTQYNLGLLYNDLHDYVKAEEYYLQALENYTQLFTQNPDKYHSNVALTQKCLADIYDKNEQFAKAEEYYLLSLENYKMLFEKQPDEYRADLAWVQYSLMYIYAVDDTRLNQYDDMLNAALENYEVLYQRAKDYQPKIVELRNRKGWRLLYTDKTDEAIVLFESTYQLAPKESTYLLSQGYNAKAYEYANNKDFTNALETIDRAIALQPEEANLYDSKGEILLMKGDEQDAVKMWQKVLELDPDFLKTHNSNLYKQLKEKGLRTE